jgi:ethanolamine ammonia-lyase large subunit
MRRCHHRSESRRRDIDEIVRLEQQLEQIVRRLELPTRYCVLSDIVKQHAARRHATIDVAFQSLAGTSKALTGMVGLDVEGIVDLARGFDALYFETGQGSEVTNDAADGIDMVTLESRTYGVARHIRRETPARWMIVNDVAGFIGPEVFRTAAQLERACLEDIVMARLHGLTMGLDVCATFHMGIDPRELRRVTARIAERAAPAYLMSVAGNADPMLGYLTTSYREHPQLRRQTRRQITSAMRTRLRELGVFSDNDARGGSTTIAGVVCDLRASGRRSTYAIGARRRRHPPTPRAPRPGPRPRHRRWRCIRCAAPHDLRKRARGALCSGRRARHHKRGTRSRPGSDRGEKSRRLSSAPISGERLREDDARTLAALYPGRHPQVQVVISDGLNANAVNEQLRALLPGLRANALRRRPSHRREGCRGRERTRARGLRNRRTDRRNHRHSSDRRAARNGTEYVIRVRHVRTRCGRTVTVEPQPRSLGDDRSLRDSPTRKATVRGDL